MYVRRFIIWVMLALAAPFSLWAEDNQDEQIIKLSEAPVAEQQFRRVKVETRPLGQRINIQIDPFDQYSVDIIIDPRLPRRPFFQTEDAAEQANWFWSFLSPDLGAGGASRITEAVAVLENRPSDAPAITADAGIMERLARDYGREILLGTMNRPVSPALVLAVIGVESSGRPEAVSSAGAIGLMQLIPDTAKRFGVAEISDPAQNIAGGAAYLEWLLDEFAQDPLMALAGYNAGENAVKQHGGIPPYAETRSYVPKVVAAWQVARNLCQTPPEYVTQGCVFKNLGPAE